MGRWVSLAAACIVVGAGSTAGVVASAHSVRVNPVPGAISPVGPPLPQRGVPSPTASAGGRGGTLTVDAHGILVAERFAGALVRADRDGRPVARLALHGGLGELVSGGTGRVFVADRQADRVVHVDSSSADALVELGGVDIAEPYGLAVTPDGGTLLVTSIADHALVAIDTATLHEKWRADLAAEPRGVAVSPDGERAVVGFLSSGALAIVDLAAAGERVAWRSLDPRDPVEIEEEEGWEEDEMIKVAVVREARSRFDVPTNTGQRRARNVFGVAYVGHGLLVAPHQLSTSQMQRIPSADLRDSYGGGPQAVPAIVHRLAVLDVAGGAATTAAFSDLAVHQPRALAYDADRDTLFVGGYGDDRIVAVADVSQPAPYVAWRAELSGNDRTRPDTCAIDGLAVDGEHLWVHCESTRRVFRLAPAQFDLDDKEWLREKAGVLAGPQLAESLRTPQVERGAELFRRGGDWRLSDSGVMACASCHPDGRQDGLSWRLGKSILQTPMLGGRVVGTAPYKWDGQDANLATSFRHTIERLGGSEFSAPSRSELDDLAAYVESLPAPHPPTVRDADAVARGRALFGGGLDCATCHDGDQLTDGQQYPLQSRGLDTTDTPSLRGVAHTAPYYHDGSAHDLYALLTDKGSVHDMAELDGLSAAQVADLTAYLRTL
jgi:cytochrome c553